MVYLKASSPRSVCSSTTRCAAKPSAQKRTNECSGKIWTPLPSGTSDGPWVFIPRNAPHWTSPARGKQKQKLKTKKTGIISSACKYLWKHYHHKESWCQHGGQHEIGHPYQHYHLQSQQDNWLPPAKIQDRLKKTKETAYKALVRPSLEYAATVWYPCTENEISSVEKA